MTNPNACALGFRRAEVGLDLEGAPLAEGSSAMAVSSTLMPFQVTTTVRNLGSQLLGVLRTGGPDYRIHATVTLTGALALEVPLSKNGRLGAVESQPEQQAAIARMRELRLAGGSLRSTEAEMRPLGHSPCRGCVKGVLLVGAMA